VELAPERLIYLGGSSIFLLRNQQSSLSDGGQNSINYWPYFAQGLRVTHMLLRIIHDLILFKNHRDFLDQSEIIAQSLN